MKNPNPAKVAVVDELKEKFTDTDGMILTEYRGLDVAAMAELRHALRQAGGEYKIYKNTLVRLAARDAGLEIEDLLVGPTALAFVVERPDGSDGDVAAVAKAIREFAKSNQLLVIKGGVLGDKPLDSDEIKALAELPSREILLAQLAGALQAPMASFAGLLSAVPRHFAYALNALIEQRGVPALIEDRGDPALIEDRGDPETAAETPAETPAEGEPYSDQPEPDTTTDAPTDDTDAPAAAPTAGPAAESGDASNQTEASADADAGDAGESGEASQEKEA